MSRQIHSLDREAFYKHKAHAKTRGIAFQFTYEEWRSWWESELAKLEPGAKRGGGRTDYGMCRFLDRGPYAPGNVYCGRPKRNRADYGVSVYLNAKHIE